MIDPVQCLFRSSPVPIFWLFKSVFFYLDYLSPLRALAPDRSGASGADPAGVQCLELAAGQLQPAGPGPDRSVASVRTHVTSAVLLSVTFNKALCNPSMT